MALSIYIYIYINIWWKRNNTHMIMYISLSRHLDCADALESPSTSVPTIHCYCEVL